jgi:hypothetical protein
MQNSNNYGATLAEVPELLKALEPFHTGTLSATEESPTYYGGGVDYVVRSYGVIIAISAYDPSYGFRSLTLADDAYNYSKTTSKHANIVKKAWGI